LRAMKILSLSGMLFSVIIYAGLLYPQTQVMKSSIQDLLVGTWRLVSTEERLRDGRTRPYPDLGPHAIGYLMYTQDGYMCATLMNPARPNWKSDQERATDGEKISAASGFTSYCGKYSVDDKNHVIMHYPEISFYPNYVGSEQKRPYRLEGNRLILSGLETEGEVERWTIVWEKVR
jgi:Lipocalin-like domain